ncbi:unnamed protein product [Brassicogethes aeneus]|uniref:Uncharacterized protein n=1 Tax=Brassicogethes aeneus TaxID=1431903 RepID=A0A9P0B1C8_BRAAE|nr:unnamed protein product [Brassicogethes aeneus]
MPLTLYSVSDGPPSLAVRQAMKALNLDFTLINVDFGLGEHMTAEFAKKNPQKEIPVLDDNGFFLGERCLFKIGKGLKHCCTAAETHKNALKLIVNLPERQKEQVITSLISDKIVNSEKFSGKKQILQNKTINLATKGLRERLTVNSKVKKDVKFSSGGLYHYQVASGTSTNQIKLLTNCIRCCAGRKSVAVRYKKNLSTALEPLYKINEFEFEIEGKYADNKKAKRPVVWCDAEDILNEVIERRNETGNVALKVMADGGQGFFKICLTIMPENYNPDENTIHENEEDEGDSITEKKRTLYSQGGSMAPIFFKYQRTPLSLKKTFIALDNFNTYFERSKTKYAAGDNITIADFQLVTATMCLEAINFDFSKYTLVKQWYETYKKEYPELWAIVKGGMKEITEFEKNPPDLSHMDHPIHPTK